MPKNLTSRQFDLVTPDGYIHDLEKIDNKRISVTVVIENIEPFFVGYQIDVSDIFFNLKSLLAQLGLHSYTKEIELSQEIHKARVKLEIIAIDPTSEIVLKNLSVGTYIGKLFACSKERRVRNPDYLTRMFGRSDRRGRPLLCFGGPPGSEHLRLEQIDGRIIAYLPVRKGRFTYADEIGSAIPTLVKGLKYPELKLRQLLRLHQNFVEEAPRSLNENELLLLATEPLHVRTCFAKVVDELLPEGVFHTSASVLQPDTYESGDIYELFGSTDVQIDAIPLEFYTLSPYQEHVFFSDRDQLQQCLEDHECLFEALDTAPDPEDHKSAVFVVKGDQLLNLQPSDWVISDSPQYELPADLYSGRRTMLLDRYIESQPSYPFLKAIEEGVITSQGILLTRYFPSPRLKRLLLSQNVQNNLKGIYFRKPSRAHGDFFSHEDRSFLSDLAKQSIPIYWVDESSHLLLKYVLKPNKDSGMFVPVEHVQTFIDATMIGVYGSNLLEGSFIDELTRLLEGLKEMRKDFDHELLAPDTPLALVTGGGPGAMAVGNKVATNLNILSCANVVDFSRSDEGSINEQNQNPYIQAKMTYSLDRLVERQAEFNLDLPIFLTGGIGTDFEFALEEVRRKVGINQASPVLLFGTKEYWQDKITTRFKCNLASGTIKGSEWVSNCFYVVRNADEGLRVYKQYFAGQLRIGPTGPISEDGFISFPSDV
ncbi:MAG: hypothetical protein MRY21_01995 [Simkaniaceae bacterium]|nr:hypothetical protein [Simkaniaceae bacterium]